MSMTLLFLIASVFYSARYGEAVGWRLMKIPGMQLLAFITFLGCIAWDSACLHHWWRK